MGGARRGGEGLPLPYVVSEAQVEFLEDEQVSAEELSGHAHVADGLTDERHGRAAAVELRQVDPGVQAWVDTHSHEQQLQPQTAGSGVLPGLTAPSAPNSESVSRSISLSRTIMAAMGLRTSCSLFWISSITLSLSCDRKAPF